MFSTPEIYLQAELAYRRDRITKELAGRAVRRPRSLWHRGDHEVVPSRRKQTVISQAN